MTEKAINTEISQHFVELFKFTRVYRLQTHLFTDALIVRLIGHTIVLCRRSTVPEMSHQLFERSKIIKTVKVHDAVVSLHVRYPMSIRPCGIVQIHGAASVLARAVDNALRMKTPLKYDMRIRLASSFNCTLVIVLDGIFIISLAVFFLCNVLSAFVRAEIQSASVFVRSEI